MSADYDLLIVGAGPAGLAAALAAAPSGARIALVDDNPAAGGQIWRDGPRASLPPRAHQMRQRLAGQANVEHFPATRVVACGPGRRLLLEDPQRGWQVGYRRLVLCTGARELLLPFPGWTLPGVTGAGGLQALAKGGLPLAGQRLVVAGSGPLLLASAASASQCGARLLRVAEQAPARTLAAFAVRLPRWPGKLWQAAGLFARSYRADSYVLAALGEERLEAVRLREGGRVREIACERLPAASAWCPTCNSARPSAIASTARRSPSTNGRPAACPTTTPPANAPASAAANWPWWKAPSPAMPPSTSATRLAACGHDGDAGRLRRHPGATLRPACRTASTGGGGYPGLPLRRRPLGRAGRACRLDRGQAAQPLRHGRLPGADMRQRRAIPVRLVASGAASAVQPGAPGDPGLLAGRRRLATLGAIQPAEAGQRQQQATQQHGCQRLGEHPVRP